MKNISKLTIVILALTAIMFISCEKDEDNNGNDNVNTSLVLNENGTEITSWVYSDGLSYSIEYEEGYEIKWINWDENSDRILYLELGGPVAPHAYELTTGTFHDTSAYAELSYEFDGMKFNGLDDDTYIKVTNVDKANKTISGTFEFKIMDNIDIEVSGEFTNFPY